MSLLLYGLAAIVLLRISHRALTPLSRWAVIVLFLLPLCFTGRALLTGGVYGPVELPYLSEPLRELRGPLGVPLAHNDQLSDLFSQMIPWRKAVQFALAHHEWPLWNPFILSGTVLAGAAQAAPYSPFTLLACLLPVAQGLTFSAALTFFLAGLGAFLFARELGCRESVALCAAAGWMYSGGLAFFVLWSMGSSWALLPLVLLGTRRCVHDPGLRSASLLAIVLTLLLLSGHPESVLHAVACGGAYGLVELAALRREVTRVLGAAAAAGAVALLLSAIYILPILEAAPQTMEHQYRTGGWLTASHGVSLNESGARLLTDAFPHLYGRLWPHKDPQWVPLETAAVGSILLAAALYALARIRRREVWFFGALALFGLLSRAAWPPLANVMQKLPLFAITLNERFSFAAAMSLVILAVLGIEHAVATSSRALAWTFATATVAIATGATLIDRARKVWDVLPQFGVYTLFGEIACAGLAAILMLAVARWRGLHVSRLQGSWVVRLLGTSGPTKQQRSNPATPNDSETPQPRDRAGVTATAIFVLIVLQRWLAAYDIYPTLRADAAYPPIPIFQPLRGIREPFRVVGRVNALVPGTSALYELEDVRGYEAMTLSRYVVTYDAWCRHQPVWFNRVDDLTRPFLSMANVRFAIASDKLPPPDGWRRVAVQRGAELLENTRVFPRAFVPDRVVFGTSFDGTLDAMKTAHDFHERAWVEAPLPAGERANDGGTVASVRRESGDLIVEAATAAGSWVVVTEPRWEGWRVYIDGRRVEHFFANSAFIAVYVPPGGHRIRVTYLPESFVRGRAISLSTLVLLLGGLVWAQIRRRRVVTIG
jgi:Bacterial membrane protein YfhO.